MIIKSFALVLGVLLSQIAFAQVGNLKITPDMLEFDYALIDGQMPLNCVPTLDNAATQDWTVQCGTPATALRKYSVHLWVTMYEHTAAPHQSYEVLYWITDLSASTPTQSSASSTTIWFNFKDPSDFTSIELFLGVENDNASLHMVLTPKQN